MAEVDHDRPTRPVAQGDVQDRAVLGEIDLLAHKHPRPPTFDVREPRQVEQEPHGLRGHSILRIVEQEIVQPERETPEAFAAQTRVVYGVIASILADCGLTTHSILRIDSWLRDGARAAEDGAICREVLGPVHYASTRTALPLSARGETEVTVLAAGPGVVKKTYDDRPGPTVTSATGFHFVGECRGIDGPPAVADLTLIANPRAQLLRALGILDTALRNCGSELSKTVLLELYLRDVYFADAAEAMLRDTFGEDCPAVAVIGADLESPVEVKLNAIAI